MNYSRSQGSEFRFPDTPPEPFILHRSAKKEDCRRFFYYLGCHFMSSDKEPERSGQRREGVGEREGSIIK